MVLKLSEKIGYLVSATKKYWHSQLNPLRSPFTFVPSTLLASGIITGLVLGIRQSGSLQSMELAAFDRMVILLPQKALDPRILIVEISEADVESQKIWPLPDKTIARLLARLQAGQPKTIGLNLYRSLSLSPGHKKLLEELQADNVVVVMELNMVPPPVGVPEERIGFNDLSLDVDSVVRRNLMYFQSADGSKSIPSFSLLVSLHYLGDRHSSVEANSDSLRIGSKEFFRLQPYSGGYQREESDPQKWQTLLRYRSKSVARRVRLSEVLEGHVEPELVKDKIILIGTTANSNKDLYFTPYGGGDEEPYLMPGVVIHAQMVSQILGVMLDDEPLFWFWTQWQEYFWIWWWSLLGGILGWRCHRPWLLGLMLAIATGGLWGIGFLVFTNAGWIPVVPPALTLLLTTGAVLSYKALHSSYYDSLTGLPNRRLLIGQLKRLGAGKKTSLALLCLDLERFKTINDGLGNQVGDRLLVAAAMRVKDSLEDNAIFARIGGDEFALLLPAADLELATKLAKRVKTEMNQPFLLSDRYIFTNFSIGIAFNKSQWEIEAEELLQNAQIAMYKAKLSGKFHYQVFVAEMQSEARARLQLENDLRMAIENQEFQIHYQPIVCLKTGKIVSFEALVRWYSPQGQIVSPGTFIPIAEETGSIVPLGKWILEQACRQMYLWQAEFPQNPPLTIGVNLSSRQFSQPDLVEQIEQTLLQVGLEPEHLKLEITESMVADNVEEAIVLLEKLKKMNLRLCIDDFGTGYSSLSYLHRFPVDTLKVDKSFVSRMDTSKENAEIVRTIVTLGHNLGMDVVAEGIETETQMKAIQNLQCEYAQGYLFSRPLSAEDTAALLASNRRWPSCRE